MTRSVPGARVRLRPLRPTDAPVLHEVLAHGGATPTWTDTLAELGRLTASGEVRALVSLHGARDEVATVVLLRPGSARPGTGCAAPPTDLELSYWTRPDLRGRGLTSAAVGEVLADRRVRRRAAGRGVTAHAHPGNAASVAVLSRWGGRRVDHDGLSCFTLGGW